jgi:hypothetical protein
MKNLLTDLLHEFHSPDEPDTVDLFGLAIGLLVFVLIVGMK